MESKIERKQRYYDWHGADLGTLGEIEDEIKKCQSVLDLGCGSGWLCREIARLGVQSVVGVDLDADAIAELNRNSLDTVEGICTASDQLPFDSNSFDLVVAKDILEHLIYPISTVQEVFRVLKPGGVMYIATPSPSSRKFWDDYTHVRPFSKRGLRALLEDAGLHVERDFYTGNYPGVGRYMRLRGSNQLPTVSHTLANLGFRRNNVHAWARKPLVDERQIDVT